MKRKQAIAFQRLCLEMRKTSKSAAFFLNKRRVCESARQESLETAAAD